MNSLLRLALTIGALALLLVTAGCMGAATMGANGMAPGTVPTPPGTVTVTSTGVKAYGALTTSSSSFNTYYLDAWIFKPTVSGSVTVTVASNAFVPVVGWALNSSTSSTTITYAYGAAGATSIPITFPVTAGQSYTLYGTTLNTASVGNYTMTVDSLGASLALDIVTHGMSGILAATALKTSGTGQYQDFWLYVPKKTQATTFDLLATGYTPLLTLGTRTGAGTYSVVKTSTAASSSMAAEISTNVTADTKYYLIASSSESAATGSYELFVDDNVTTFSFVTSASGLAKPATAPTVDGVALQRVRFSHRLPDSTLTP